MSLKVRVRLLCFVLCSVACVAQDAHPFFDAANFRLFVGVGVVRALDVSSTRAFRRVGIHEAILTDSFVDNHAAFTSMSAGAVAANVGGAYLLHRAGHHKLERWASRIHVIAVGGTVAWNYEGLRRHLCDGWHLRSFGVPRSTANGLRVSFR